MLFRIMNLVADKEALKETLSYVEQAYKEKRIDLETLLRVKFLFPP